MFAEDLNFRFKQNFQDYLCGCERCTERFSSLFLDEDHGNEFDNLSPDELIAKAIAKEPHDVQIEIARKYARFKVLEKEEKQLLFLTHFLRRSWSNERGKTDRFFDFNFILLCELMVCSFLFFQSEMTMGDYEALLAQVLQGDDDGDDSASGSEAKRQKFDDA